MSVFRRQHGMPDAPLLLLPHEDHVRHLRDGAKLRQPRVLALLVERALQHRRVVEVVLDGALSGGSYHDDLLDAGSDGLLHDVVDDGLVDEGQHLLGVGLGYGEHARPVAGGEDKSLANAHPISVRMRKAGGILQAASFYDAPDSAGKAMFRRAAVSLEGSGWLIRRGGRQP